MFGFADIRRVGTRTVGDRQFAVTLEGLGGRVPVVVVPPADELDRPSTHLPTDGRRRSAASALQDWLNASEDALWGLCCNGVRLRLVRDNASLTRPAYIEADLRAHLRGARTSPISRRCGCSSMPAASALPGRRHRIARWNAGARPGQKEGVAARDRLRDGVEAALLSLGNGFLSHPDNAALRERAAVRRAAAAGVLRPASAPRLPPDLPARGGGPQPPAPAGRARRGRASSMPRAIPSARCATAPCGAPPGTGITTAGKGC